MLAVHNRLSRNWRRFRMAVEEPMRRIYGAIIAIEQAPVPGCSEITRVQVWLGNDVHTLWLRGAREPIGPIIEVARRSRYGKTNRIGGSIIHGYLAATHRATVARGDQALRCLLIGYGSDTYDAQLLANLGWEVTGDFVDVLDEVPADPRWLALKSLPGVRGATYHQLDARQLKSHFPEKQYDLILIARGSIEYLPLEEFLSILGECYQLLGPTGAIVVSVSTLQLTPAALAAGRRRLWLGAEDETPQPSYTSRLGTFHLLSFNDRGRFVEPFWSDLGFDAHTAILERLRCFAEEQAVFCELSDLLAGDMPDWLGKLALVNGRSGRLLRLAELPGEAFVGAFDIYRRPLKDRRRWLFSVRTTLHVHRPEGLVT